MKKYACILWTLFQSCIASAQIPNADSSLYNLNAARLTIHGTTNVNEFQCRYRNANITADLKYSICENIETLELDGPDVPFPVIEFACEKNLMTREFRQLLRIDEHPEIVMCIGQISFTQGGRGTYKPVSADAVLNIAGRQSAVRIDHARIRQRGGQLVFSGMHPVAMSHFGIRPPEKFLGTVRTDDLLEIGFEFIFDRSE